MRLKFCGAAREVTGSNYLLEVGGHRVLIDCGIYQGTNEEANKSPFPYAANSIDALLLTHAHMDHSGRIPKLVKEGFKGKIYTTLPTAELCDILWDDSVRLMAEDAQRQTVKNARRGLPPEEPLFEQSHADKAKELIVPVSYDSPLEVTPGVAVRFRDAGHILGSAILELTLTEEEKTVSLVFSGDLGPMNTVMERAPAAIAEADYVVIESTYGNREHKDNKETREEFQALMKSILAQKRAKVYIPTFVVDRAQRIMYELSLLRDQGIGQSIPVYFDSPMGVKATRLYNGHMDLMSNEIQDYRRKGGKPFSEEHVQYVATKEQSQSVNSQPFGIVLAGSGMCNGGRIVHHLKNGIWDPQNHMVFVGYQAYGTLGRKIVDGAKTVRIFGESINVEASVHTIGGFSAHADRTDLLKWADGFRQSNPKFFVTHGEPVGALGLVEALKTRGFEAIAPRMEQEVTLEPREAGQRISLALAQSAAAPQPAPIAESPVPADPSSAAALSQEPATAAAQNERPIQSAQGATDNHAVRTLEAIGDQMRELYLKASAGQLPAEAQPLFDAVSLLLDAAAKK